MIFLPHLLYTCEPKESPLKNKTSAKNQSEPSRLPPHVNKKIKQSEGNTFTPWRYFFLKEHINKIRFKNKNQFKCTYPVFSRILPGYTDGNICKCIFVWEGNQYKFYFRWVYRCKSNLNKKKGGRKMFPKNNMVFYSSFLVNKIGLAAQLACWIKNQFQPSHILLSYLMLQ